MLTDEPAADELRSRLEADEHMLVWALTPDEIDSALERLRRSGALAARELAAARERLADVEARWNEVGDLPLVRDRARALLKTHPLSSSDAAQLAAALLGRGEHATTAGFASLARQLSLAAAKEGFTTIP